MLKTTPMKSTSHHWIQMYQFPCKPLHFIKLPDVIWR